MNSVWLVFIAIAGYLVAYRTYGRFLAQRIFKINPQNRMPSFEFEDGVDYVPTRKSIVFGHHFTTIAGLGPIVGPAIGLIWGWVPALIWILFGSVFMGAVHDFSTLVISARNQGKTIGDLTGRIIGEGPRYAFQGIIQLLLFMVLSIFALIVSTLFMLYPESVLPVWLQIPIAVWLGRQLRKGLSEWLNSLVAIVLMYGSIWLGAAFPVDLSRVVFIQWIASQGFELANVITVCWCLLLFVYVFFASTLPVHRLLQPRDYINSQQLLVAIALLLVGVFIAHPVISAPGINRNAFAEGNDVPNMFPILFIIIACGAISGFHSIASSGTTVKQLKNEKDALLIGFGSMLTEGFLAVLVLVCIAAGLGMGFEQNGVLYSGSEAFYHYYTSWSSANAGIGAKLGSFITGSANILGALGIPLPYGKALIAVFIVSFANTTLDSATRMQRLSLQELCTTPHGRTLKPFSNRYFTTLAVVAVAAVMTFLKPGGKGALLLWPLFGALNQLLAALGLTVVSVYLHQKAKNFYIALVPMLFVLTMTIWSMLESLIGFIANQDVVLVVVSLVVLALTVWLLIGGIKSVFHTTRKPPTN